MLTSHAYDTFLPSPGVPYRYRIISWLLKLPINRGAQNVACVGGCVVVPGGVWGGISAGPRGLFSAMLAVAIVLMMVC